MKMIKKIVLLTVLVSQAPALNCAPRACGCQRPQQPQPQQQPQQVAQPVVKQDASMDLLIEECCTMLMDEAQKLNNSCLAEEITEMVTLVKAQEARKCACMKPKPQQPPQVQVPVQAQAPEAQERLATEPEPEIASRVLLSECCSALLDEAKNRNDQESIGRIDMIMEKVTMIPCATK